MKKHIKKIITLIVVILFIVLDQVSKIFLAKDIMVIEGLLKFTNVHNTGGAFGIFSTNTVTIIIVSIMVLALMIRFIIIKKDYMGNFVYTGLVFIIAGAISNLIDRIFRGYVVDFIDFTQIVNFPVFNFADIVLVIGWILLVIGVFKDIKKDVSDI